MLMLVIFLIAQLSPDLRCLAETTQPYAPWPSSLTNWYSESTTKVELRAWKECLCMAESGEREVVVSEEEEG